MKYLTLLMLLASSVYSDTFELKDAKSILLHIERIESNNTKEIFRDKSIEINNYQKICIDEKLADGYVLINNETSLNRNFLCHDYNKNIEMSFSDYIDKLKQGLIPLLTGINFTKKDLRIKSFSTATGDEIIKLTLSQSQTPTFIFNLPIETKIFLWSEKMKEKQISNVLNISHLNKGKYGLVIENKNGKKIMEFEITIKE